MVFKRIWNYLLIFQRSILIISGVLILLGLFTTVLLRYIFQTDLFGLEELIIVPAIWMYFMGASYATYNKSHITADISDTFVKRKKSKLLLRLINSIITLVIVLIYSYWSLGALIWSYQSGSSSNVWNLPQFVPQSAILVGFLLMVIYVSTDLAKDIREINNMGKLFNN